MEATRSKEHNKFFKLKTKIANTKQNIQFIRSCKNKKVFPSFMKVYTSVTNERSKKVLQSARKHWIKLELAHHYATLGRLELEAYNLHLTLTKNCDVNEWNIFHNHMCIVIDHKTKHKVDTLKKKLNNLRARQQQSPTAHRQTVPFIDSVVKNESSISFTPAEMTLLNKGLKFALPPIQTPIEDIVVAIQSNLAYTTAPVKNELLVHSTKVLTAAKSKPIDGEALRLRKIVKSIKSNDITISKADKGNGVVILDNDEYLRRMDLMLEEGDYTLLSTNPLNKMKTKVDEVLKKYSCILGRSTIWQLKNSNPQVPRLYGLPKIHKPGQQMRPIASNINAPTQKIAKWLIQQFKLLDPPPSLSVKNSIDFVEKVKNLRITRNETMISFDVKSLFPSIPIDKALVLLEKWLDSKDVPKQQCNMYIEMAKICMEQNIFQFNGKFYHQRKGTAMGNSLSGFLAEIFMSSFEMEMKANLWFPRIWYRYVDDVFAICASRKVDAILDKINKYYSSIQFTCERESNSQLPFLDVMITRIDTKLDFSIYRKSTYCERLIPADSYHHHSHKMAVFHSMIHRMLNITMSASSYTKELDYIHHLARVNGYDKREIDNILNKHIEKNRRSQMSTFFDVPNDDKPARRIGMPYYPAVTKILAPVFREHDIVFAPRSTATMKSLLGSNKDDIPMLKKSGIYEVSCQSGCDAVYYGKTIRSVEKRFTEHIYQFRNGNKEKSSVAKHLIENNHSIDLSHIKLVEEVNNNRQIEIIEAIHIRKNRHKNLMNSDTGNVQSTLINLF